jgi:hypothetical protein
MLYKTTWWKKTAMLAACVTLLPFVGSPYRMLYFFIPLIFFLIEKREDPKDLFHVVLFGLIFIPLSYFHFTFDPLFLAHPAETDDTVLLRPIVVAILLISLIVDTVRQRKPNEPFLSQFRRLYSLVWRPNVERGIS